MEPTYRMVKQSDKNFADAVIKAKNKDPWEAIDLMVEYWMKKKPTEYKSFVLDVKDTRSSRGDSFGRGRDARGKKSAQRRLIDLPSDIWQMIVVIFGDKEMLDPYSKDFFTKLWERYPLFRIAEKR